MFWFKIDFRRGDKGTVSEKVDDIQEIQWNPCFDTLSDYKFCFVEMIILFKTDQGDGTKGHTYLVHLNESKLNQFDDYCTYNEPEKYNEILENEGNYWGGFLIEDFTSNDPFLQEIFDEIEEYMEKFYREVWDD
tara:strand:- start:75 stop:476 length:402 start_codon:yes stop_codon:yes gene_type:complete